MEKEDILKNVSMAIVLLQRIEAELTRNDESHTQSDPTVLDEDLLKFLRRNHAGGRLINTVRALSTTREEWENSNRHRYIPDNQHMFLGNHPKVRDLVENYRPKDVLRERNVGRKTLIDLTDILLSVGIKWC